MHGKNPYMNIFPVLGVDAKLPLETLTLPQLIVARKQKINKQTKPKQ